MKKLVLFTLFFVATVCSAQVSLQINKEGVYKEYIGWTDVAITAHPEAIKYSLKFSEAISNPGEKILVEKSERIIKLNLLFKKQVEIREFFILYNSQANNIDYIEDEPIKKEKYSYLILVSIASILLMRISNMLFKKNQGAFIAVIVAVIVTAAASAVIVLGDNVTLIINTLTVGAFVAVAAAAVAEVGAIYSDEKKEYIPFSIIFYILMAIHIILLFI